MNNNIFTHTKHIALLLILAGTFPSCQKEDINPDKYRKLKILHFAKSTDAEPAEGVEYSYDKSGNMVKESFFKYKPVTDCYMYCGFEYAGNKKVKMELFDKDKENFKLFRYYDFIYENNRLVREECRSDKGLLLSTMNYEFQGGNMVREYFFEPDYGISKEVKYTYDSKNRLTLEEFETSDIKEVKFTKYIYDDDGRDNKLEYYNPNWDLIKSVERIYNGHSKLPVKELHFDKDGSQIFQYQHYYDKRGNLTETRLNDGCSLFKRKYDGGLLMEEIHYLDPVKYKDCSDNGMTRYEYQKQ